MKIWRIIRHIFRRFCCLKSKVLVTALLLSATFLFIAHEQHRLVTITRFTDASNVTNSSRIDVTIAYKRPADILNNYDDVSNQYFQHGQRIARNIKKMCDRLETSTPTQESITVRWNKKHDIWFCPIYKVATTFWRRVFMLDGMAQYKTKVNPFVIPFDKDYLSSKLSVHGNFTDNYKFMFTRDPYSRLLSFYIDKLVAPNPVFWRDVGLKAIKFDIQKYPPGLCGHHVTFAQFIRYVIHTLKTRNDVDPHWVGMADNCRPCAVHYDFVGTMETFSQDSNIILREMRLNSTADFLEQHGANESDIDALKDTISQPFKFYARYRRCLSFEEAIVRAWTKLQLRGLVGEDSAPKNIKLSQRGYTRLLQKAIDSRNDSPKDIRKKLKRDAVREFWKQIDVGDLYSLRDLYHTDFFLFGYNPEPDQIFQARKLSNTTRTP